MSLMGSVMGGAMGIQTGIRTIDDVTRDVLREKARIGSSIIAIGRNLVEAKGMLSHGEWLPWLREQAGFSERSAQQYMQVATTPALSANPKLVSYLGLVKSTKISALPEAEQAEFIVSANAAGEDEKRVSQLAAEKLAHNVQAKSIKMELPSTGLTRWGRVMSGGVGAMADLLVQMRDRPEQFPPDIRAWLLENDIPF